MESWSQLIFRFKSLNREYFFSILFSASLFFTPQTSQAADLTANWSGGASGDWNNASNWSTTNFPNNGADNYEVNIDNGITGTNATVDLNVSSTIDSLMIDAGDELSILNSIFLNVGRTGATNSITNNGVIGLNSTGNASDLSLTDDLSYQGTGKITVSNNLANRIVGNSNTLTVANANTLLFQGDGGAGQMQFGVNSLTTIINGQIDFDNVTVNWDPTDSNGVDNNGLVRAINGSDLNLFHATYLNTGGTFQAEAGSNIDFVAGTINGGVVHSIGTGRIRGQGGTLDDVTNTGTIDVNNNTNIGITGTFTNNGVVALKSSGNASDLQIRENNTTYTGSGKITFTNNNNNRIDFNSNRLLIADGATMHLQGDGGAGQGQFMTNNGRLTVGTGSTLNVDNVLLTINPVDGGAIGSGNEGVINNGVIQASNGGTWRTALAVYNNNSGTLQALAGSAIQIWGGGEITGGAVIANAGTVSLGSNGSLTNATMSSQNGGVAQVESGSTGFINGVTISAGLDLALKNGSSLFAQGTVVNDGVISLDATAASTQFRLNGDMTYQGTGKITATNNGNNRIGDAGAYILTVDTGVTMHVQGDGGIGQVQYGNNELKIVNNGIVDFDNMTAFINTTDSVGDFDNNGTIRSRNGSTVTLQGVTQMDNTGGTVEALTGSTINIGTSARVSGGNVTTAGTGKIKGTGGTFDDVTSTASVEVDNGMSIGITGTFTNNGTIALQTGGSATDLQIRENNTTYTGSGKITLTNNNNNRVNFLSNRLLIADGATMEIEGDHGGVGGTGQGQFMTDNGSLTVGTGSTLEADNVLLNMNPKNTGTIGAGDEGVINNGVIQARNGGSLRTYNGVYNNNSGTFQALANSAVQIWNSASITGGSVIANAGTVSLASSGSLTNATMSSQNGGVAQVESGSSGLINGVTISAGLDFDVENNSTLFFQGIITNNGSIGLNSTGNNSIFSANGNATYKGTGVITATNQGNNRIGDTGAFTLTVDTGVNMHIQGDGGIGQVQYGNNELKIVNDGVVDFDNMTAFINVTDSAGDFDNNGTIRSRNGSTVVLQGASNFDNTGGTIEALTGSTVRIDSGAVVSGGTVATAGTGEIVANNGSLENVASTGLLKINNNTSLYTKGTFTNSGTVELNSSGNASNFYVNEADVTLGGSGLILVTNNNNNRFLANISTYRATVDNGATLHFQGNGGAAQMQTGANSLKMTVNGTLDYDNITSSVDLTDAADSFTNTGTVNIRNNSNISFNNISNSYVNNGEFNINTGATLNINESFSGTGSWVINGGQVNINFGEDVLTTGNITVSNGGNLTLVNHASNASISGANLTITDGGANNTVLSVNSDVTLTGDFSFNLTDETDMSWGANANLNMNGGVGSTTSDFSTWAKLEFGGQNFGTDPSTHTGAAAGFTNNFNLSELVIGAGAHIQAADLIDNGNRIDNGFGTAEALYVDILTFADGAGQFLLNGLDLYYNTLNGLASQILSDNTFEATHAEDTGNVALDVGGNNPTILWDDLTSDGQTNFALNQAPPSEIESLGTSILSDLSGNPLYYDITTSATFNGMFDVTFDLTGVNLQGFSLADVVGIHYRGTGDFDLLPVSVNGNLVTFSASSFSGFGVGVNPEPTTLFLLGSGLSAFFLRRRKSSV